MPRMLLAALALGAGVVTALAAVSLTNAPPTPATTLATTTDSLLDLHLARAADAAEQSIQAWRIVAASLAKLQALQEEQMRKQQDMLAGLQASLESQAARAGAPAAIPSRSRPPRRTPKTSKAAAARRQPPPPMSFLPFRW